jgi:hypothetical protein
MKSNTIQLVSNDEDDVFMVSYSKINRMFCRLDAQELITVYLFICMRETINDHRTSILDIHHVLKEFWSLRKIEKITRELISLKIIGEKK